MHVPAHAYNIKHAGLDTGVPDLFEYAARNMAPVVDGLVIPMPDSQHVVNPILFYDESTVQTLSTVMSQGFSGYYHVGNRGGEYADWNGDGPNGYYTVEIGTIYETLDFDLFPNSSGFGIALIQKQLDESSRTSALFLLAHSTKAIDADGYFSINYPAQTGLTPGHYAWWAVDNANGKKTSELPYDITVPQLTLTLLLDGTGSGTVTINPTGYSTNTSTTAQFPSGTTLQLHPVPSEYSLFSGWSGSVCSGTGDCSFSLVGDTTVSATFSKDSEHQVRLIRDPAVYFSSLTAALNAALPDDTIQAWAIEFSNSLAINKSVVIKGGYSTDYSSNSSGYSVVKGTVTIVDGKLTIENIQIR
ncbi:MAG: hypothetical protein A2X82_02325 [Geobacteraceae bacterium GWC2_55_20]|nr:MAG: hypothetical protein A2X82_02325 [Geobacteraceae bacterium GWC2_55_20]OGU20232.1 MAG: hypothetical protein A2X85_06775 [Geobacteraceae bacterium GWF2_54_21]HBA72251.1 hypothetical protein [Geobacter sp.]HCE67638.1 hypothetical protein [Geobacter sp.]